MGGGEQQLDITGADGGASQLNDPVALALGPHGFVYVLDKGDRSVGVFSQDGAFVRQVGLGEVISDPTGIAVGGDGRIFIANKSQGAQVFTLPAFSDVPWQGAAATQVLSLGAVEEAAAIAVDGSGTVVVLDGRQGRIWGGSRLDPAATTQTRALYGGVGRGRGSFRRPVGLAFTPERHLVVLDRDVRKVERIELTEGEDGPRLEWEYPIRVSQLPPDPVGAVTAVAPATDGTARFVMASPQGRGLRVDRVTSERYEDLFGDVFDSYVIPETGGPETLVMGFQRTPGAITLNDSVLVVTEPDEDRFAVFDVRDGSSLGTFGRDYDDDRQLNKPVGVALFSDGSVVVADRDNHRVAVFSSDLTSLLASFPLLEAWGVALSPDGELFAWSEEGLSVLRIPLDGAPPQAVAPALLTGPVQDVKFDARGNLFVLEQETSRVTVVDSGLERVLVRLGGPRFEVRGDTSFGGCPGQHLPRQPGGGADPGVPVGRTVTPVGDAARRPVRRWCGLFLGGRRFRLPVGIQGSRVPRLARVRLRRLPRRPEGRSTSRLTRISSTDGFAWIQSASLVRRARRISPFQWPIGWPEKPRPGKRTLKFWTW